MREVIWTVRVRARALCRCPPPQILTVLAQIEDHVLRAQRPGFEAALCEMLRECHEAITQEMLAICMVCGGERREERE